MQNNKLTHSDAEIAVKNGSYKTLNNDVLLEMRRACLNAGGHNHSAIQRVHEVGKIIAAELVAREQRQKQHASFPVVAARHDDSISRETSATVTGESVLWDEQRLLNLIRDRIEENLSLEYKAAPALSREGKSTAEITKDVSAMANSGGGTLIYGLAEFRDKARKHLPERIDPVDRSQFSKEWLEQITAQIRPRISNFKIHPVQLSSAANHVAYVLEIPLSETAHQATDCKYYRRYNFESVPMVDYEIRDVMNRKTHPKIIVGANLVVWPKPNEKGANGRLVFHLHNESDVFARYVVLVVNAPIRIQGKPVKYEAATIDDTDEGTGYKLVFSNHDAAPLFPRARLSPWFEFQFVSAFTSEPEKQLSHFRFLAFADSMPLQNGSFSEGEIISEAK